IELEAQQRGYKKLTETDWEDLKNRVKNLLTFIRTDGVQDVVVSEGKPIVVKTKGIMSNNITLDSWTEDTFNFFVWQISNQSIEADMGIRVKLSKALDIAKKVGVPYSGWLNQRAVRDLLDENNMSYDYSVSLGDKTLRVHLMYTYSPVKSDRRSVTMAIRVNATQIPLWEDLN